MATTSFPVRWLAPSSRSTAAGSSDRSWSSQARSSRSIMASSRRSRRRRGQGAGVGSDDRIVSPAPAGRLRTGGAITGPRSLARTGRATRSEEKTMASTGLCFTGADERRVGHLPRDLNSRLRGVNGPSKIFLRGGRARRPQSSWRSPPAIHPRAWRRNAPGVICATRRNARANETVDS